MEKTQAEHLAEVVRTVRPDWDKPGIVTYLVAMGGALPDVTAHALRVAGDRANRTPAALAFTRPTPEPDAGVDLQRHPGNPAPCAVCGRSEWACERARANGVRIGNGVHERHPGREWSGVDEHEYRAGAVTAGGAPMVTGVDSCGPREMWLASEASRWLSGENQPEIDPRWRER